MLEIASPAVSVRNDRSIDQSRKSHRQCSRQASRLPQSPERPDETRFDHPLLNRRGDSDCKVKDPENRLENRDSQIGPRVQGADEPKAYFRRSEQDADEHEGYADDPSSVGAATLPFYLENENAASDYRVGKQEHLQDPEWCQRP